MKTKKRSKKPKLKKYKRTKRKQKEVIQPFNSFIGLTLLGETGKEIITELSSQKPVLKYKKSKKRDKLTRKRSGNLGNLVIPDSEFIGTGVEYKHTCDHQEIYQNDLQKFNLKLLAIEIDEFFNIVDTGNTPGWWFPGGVPADTSEYHIDRRNILFNDNTIDNSETKLWNPSISFSDPESFILGDAPSILDLDKQ